MRGSLARALTAAVLLQVPMPCVQPASAQARPPALVLAQAAPAADPALGQPVPAPAAPPARFTSRPPQPGLFMNGVLGGLFGSGIFGLLRGKGIFGGLNGASSVIGFFIQLVLLVLLLRALLLPAMRRAPGRDAAQASPPEAAPAPNGPPIALVRADYDAFEALLKAVQAAWTAKDQDRMRELATPDMVTRFGDRIQRLHASGHRNSITQVKLEHGKLDQAWAGRGRDHARVSLRYTMVDVTRDTRGYLVDGSADEHVSVTELWTFERVKGSPWQLAAVEEAR